MTCHSLSLGALLGCLSFLQSGCTGMSAAAGTERRTEMYTSGGQRIKVETFAPVTSGRFPAVLVLHGSAGTLLGKGQLVDLCEKLVAEGKVAMLVHYFDRTGTHWTNDDMIHQQWPAWVAAVKDGVDFAMSHPRVRSDAIGLFGYSLGAYVAVSESAGDRRVKAVVELAGGLFDAQKDSLEHLPPLLILHGRDDQRVRVARALELERLARRLGRSPKIKIYDGEGHVFSATATADATVMALAFFREHLST